MNEHFFLENDTAKMLFHEYMADLPIFDYHCHLPPEAIASDSGFKSITEAWLADDHYKWRIMRACGVEEKLITGTADDYDKFLAYAKSLSRAVGNPVYQWTHLELERYFDCNLILSEDTAREIFDHCNSLLGKPGFTARSIIKRSRVSHIVTTDSPEDDLRFHKAISEDPGCDVVVMPGWRPDALLKPMSRKYAGYISSLGESAGVNVTDIASLFEAITNRLDYFEAHGCRSSDHGIYEIPNAPSLKVSERRCDALFKKSISDTEITTEESDDLITAILLFLAREYHKRGWIMELHFGARRDTNTAAKISIGSNTGFDSIGYPRSDGLAKFLDTLNSEDKLPKSVIFSSNPVGNASIATLAASFPEPGIPGKIQHGTAWWFNDNKSGIESHMTTLASMGVIGNFIGMLTDSRSFLSFTRHEYFRRILCNLLGRWHESSEFECNPEHLGSIARDIGYYNAKRYFGFN